MFVSRILLLSIVFALSCKQVSSLSSAEDNGEQALPSLYDKDYGTIEYTEDYNSKASKWGVEEATSKINTFWAQEAIGTPEARSFLEEMRKEGFAFSSPKLAIVEGEYGLLASGHPRFASQLNKALRDKVVSGNNLDGVMSILENRPDTRFVISKSLIDIASDSTYYSIEKKGNEFIVPKSSGLIQDFGESHGASVIGLMVGEHPVGVSTHGVVHTLLADLDKPATSFAEGKASADVINCSQALPELMQAKFDFKGLPATTLWINSVGNDFPYPLTEKKKVRDKVIMVGSADPSGFPSTYSQADRSVVVLAPSDEFVQSINAEGKIVKFGGTSGAAPLVSGVLADVKAILPDLTRDEAVKMLQATATRTSINSVSAVNGAGVLNHYKILRVAQRIAIRLQENGTATISSLLQDPKITRFHDETMLLLTESQQAHKLGNRTEAFKKLRQAFFLTDSRDPIYKMINSNLAHTYAKAGHSASAAFYRTPLQHNEWDYLLHRYVEKIRNRGENQKIILEDGEDLANKLYYRNSMMHRMFMDEELNSFRSWVKNNKGEHRLKEIAIQLDELDKSLTTRDGWLNITDILANSETSDNRKAIQSILFAVSTDENFTNKDIKLILEYAKETFDGLSSKELQSITHVFRTKGRIKKSSSATSIDSLIKALL